jgi:cyclomaltodextrinase
MKPWIFALTLSLSAAVPSAQAACSKAPLQQRDVFVRGSLNSWVSDDAWRMAWRCDHYELIAAPRGDHQFKLADDDWSADADWGLPAESGSRSVQAQGNPLALRGLPIEHRFDGTPKRFELRFTQGLNQPFFRMSDCQSKPPLGDTQLYLRGTMNNWAALDDYAFRWHCDAYLLNVDIKNRHDFKISDAAWGKPSIVAANSSGEAATEAQGGVSNFQRSFEGEHTLTLRFDAQGRPSLAIGPKSFIDGSDARITDATALAVRFDSRSTEHKRPFGAQPQGAPFQFRVWADVPGLKSVTLVVERRELVGNQEKLEYHPLARVALAPKPHGLGTRFEGEYRFDAIGVYGYWFEVETAEGRYALQNNKDSVYWTREKGSMGPAMIEALPENTKRIRRYRQTIHLPELKVPAWASDLVYYYVFPERYRNGDKRNDPQPGRDKYQNHGVERHARWLERPYRPGDADNLGDAIYNNDFFGGDLAGLIEKLDDIRSLGANALYLTPIFRAASNHKYDTGDYLQIDPGFGTNADFERLTREASKRGMRVIVDTSLNHVGSDSPYFDRFGNFGGKTGAFAGGKPNPQSPYFDWFKFDLTQSDPNQQYQGWVGIGDLPELDKSSESWRRFAYRDDTSVTRTWLRRGASGWRMDVAPWVPDDFWREWAAVVKQEKPDALTVAETWFDSSKYFLGDTFDSTMNYIFRNAVLDFAAGGKASSVYQSLELTRESYPAPMLQASMSLLSTHDQARALHAFGITHDPYTSKSVDPAKLAQAKQRLRLAVLFQMTFPGAPTVYYGDEVGVGGSDDPYNRATYPWPDEGGKPDRALRADFKRLIALRHAQAVLRRGSLQAPLHLDDHLIAFERTLGEQRALVVLNNDLQPRTLRLSLSAGQRWRDALSPTNAVSVNSKGELTLTVPPLFGRVLLSER